MTGILNLPGLTELGMKELEFEYHVKAEPAVISRMCPNCGELHRVQKHGSRSTFIRDLPTHGNKAIAAKLSKDGLGDGGGHLVRSVELMNGV